jgi:restriction endonuclease Mrr
LAIPEYQALMLPVLKIAAYGETRVPQAAEMIADSLGLSDEERSQLRAVATACSPQLVACTQAHEA